MIVSINDFVSYEAKTVEELKEKDKESLEEYLENCKVLKKEPNNS